MSFRAELLDLVNGHDRFAVVTVIEVTGSAPREVGARMVVTADSSRGSIGGGSLEHRAIDAAQKLLAEASEFSRRTEFAGLGVTLKQCCGGAVQLMYEVFAGESSRRFVGELAVEYRRRPRMLVSCISSERETELVSHRSEVPYMPDEVWDLARDLTLSGECSSRLVTHQSGQWFITHLDEYPTRVVLFGAGHVGKALVKLLQDLPFQIDWVDQRGEMFPEQVPGNVRTFLRDNPLDVIEGQPAGVFYVVMTHSHGLDYELCLRILRHRSFGWLGLIGSETKRHRFEQRLVKDGIDPFILQQLICPIGLPGIRGKYPAVIAMSTAAQLLEARNQASRRDSIDFLLKAEMQI